MNDENLVNLRDRSQRERKEIARMGAIASNKAQKEKRLLKDLIPMILETDMGEEAHEKIKAMNPLIDDDKNIATGVAKGLVMKAMQGDANAYDRILELQKESKDEDETDKKYRMSILGITIDFVEVYRVIHETFETGRIREIIIKGGRGSVKSNFLASIAKETIKNDAQAHVVFTRRYKTDLRGSVYNQFIKTVTRDEELDEWEFTTSPMKATYIKTGQIVWFLGADKPISAKSATLPFGYVKLLIHEECDEMAGVEQMDSIEDTFLRSDVNAIDIKVFNPPKSANNFMNKYTTECMTKDTTYICHSYYYNVPKKWLGQRFFDRAEWFKKNKPKYYANNYLGEVVGTGGTIFENIEIRKITDEEINSLPYFNYGLDWGYTHPQAFIESSYNIETDELFAVSEVRMVKFKQQTFARAISKFKKCEIIADSEAPDKIADYRDDYGFSNMIGATKRWKGGGRDYAWEWVATRKKIVIDPERTPHLLKELQEAEHEQLKDGTFSSAYPKLNEDCICAMIYSMNREILDSKREDLYDDYEDDYDE